MASAKRRPAPIAGNFSRDRRMVGGTDHATRRAAFDDRSVRIVALVSALGLLWAIDTFVFGRAMWNAIGGEIAPSLRRWHWAWTTYWDRGA